MINQFGALQGENEIALSAYIRGFIAGLMLGIDEAKNFSVETIARDGNGGGKIPSAPDPAPEAESASLENSAPDPAPEADAHIEHVLDKWKRGKI